MPDGGAELVGQLPGAEGTDEALPGDVVRTLFDRNEQVLDALKVELDEATAEADQAEARVRAHPALGLLAADEVEVLVPPERAPEPVAGPTGGPPRTTVDRRPSRVVPTPEAVVPGGSVAGVEDAGRPLVTRVVTSHWVWKVGVAVVVVALLLVKFG